MPYTPRQLRDAAGVIAPVLALQAVYDRTPGVAFGLVHGDDVVLLGSHGVEDLDTGRRIDPERTTFRCASITKTFTATIIMRLFERRRLRLDDAVTTLLPWAKPSLSPELTVRHLLMHAGSLIRDGSNSWEGPLMPDQRAVREEVLEGGAFGDPSERFRYSNVAYSLLGEIAETVSGRSFATLVRREVTAPLAMASTWSDLTAASGRNLATGYWIGHPDEPLEAAPRTQARAVAPAGGLVSRVPDLLAYQCAHFPGDTRILSEYAKREMQRAQWSRADEPHYGLGWMLWTIGGTAVVGHSGGFPGFATKIAFAPRERLAAAVLTNANSPTAQVGLERVYQALGWVRSVWEAAATASRWQQRTSLSRFVGLYRSHGADRLAVRVNNALFLLDPADPFSVPDRLEATGRLKFRLADGYDFGNLGEEVRFHADARGRVVGLRYGARELTRSPL